LIVQEPAVYFARTIRAEDPLTFAAYLHQYYVPAWDRMRADRVIESIATFLTTQTLEQFPELPRWNILQVGRVPDGAIATTFFETEREAVGRLGHTGHRTETDDPSVVTLRCETLRTTPNAHSPTPTTACLARRDDVIMSVEYIRVTPTPEALEEYQRLMVQSSGPAMRLLVDAGVAYNFMPLETDRVLSQSAPMPDWNQLHLMGMFPVPPAAFKAQFDDAITRANPTSGGFEGVFRRFDAIRTKPRWDLARELAALRIE
jgi:hypothetical protein